MLTPRVLITKGNNDTGIPAPIKAEEGTTDLVGTRTASLERDRKPDLATLTAPPKTSSPRRVAKSSRLKGSKSLAVGASSLARPSNDAKLTVILMNYKLASVHINAKRSDRLADALRTYALGQGLNFESLSVERSCKPVNLKTRLGTIVERYLDVCSFDVIDTDNLPDPNPFSEYDSDS